jgi:hypothetical protein
MLLMRLQYLSTANMDTNTLQQLVTIPCKSQAAAMCHAGEDHKTPLSIVKTGTHTATLYDASQPQVHRVEVHPQGAATIARDEDGSL